MSDLLSVLHVAGSADGRSCNKALFNNWPRVPCRCRFTASWESWYHLPRTPDAATHSRTPLEGYRRRPGHARPKLAKDERRHRRPFATSRWLPLVMVDRCWSPLVTISLFAAGCRSPNVIALTIGFRWLLFEAEDRDS